jgi:hypothetical protein
MRGARSGRIRAELAPIRSGALVATVAIDTVASGIREDIGSGAAPRARIKIGALNGPFLDFGGLQTRPTHKVPDLA